ncbi:hypothetical protein JCM33374_g2009 [Metschnikowia sp. JCM 33374]|nr:hypothetical protein JCM33374_g2009 [Metschnikowia sp. JCM 33374]
MIFQVSQNNRKPTANSTGGPVECYHFSLLANRTQVRNSYSFDTWDDSADMGKSVSEPILAFNSLDEEISGCDIS